MGSKLPVQKCGGSCYKTKHKIYIYMNETKTMNIKKSPEYTNKTGTGPTKQKKVPSKLNNDVLSTLWTRTSPSYKISQFKTKYLGPATATFITNTNTPPGQKLKFKTQQARQNLGMFWLRVWNYSISIR
jgi:hypothetical protein